MSNEFNPYEAPIAPIAEDFIAVEPRRRPEVNFIIAAVCFGASAFVLGILVLFLSMTIDQWLRAGTKWENHPIRFGPRDLILAPIGFAALTFFLAGRSFWTMQNRRGVVLVLVALGLFASIFAVGFLVYWLFP